MRKSIIKSSAQLFRKHTIKGFDQENNAWDKANDTQSAGVPDQSLKQKTQALVYKPNRHEIKFKSII